MRFGGIVLAAVVLLGACSSDPAPKEPKTPTSTTAETPTRPVPTMPAQASEDSSEGAAAFVKHYVDVFNYAAATGDVDELSRLSAPDCEGCQSYIKLYKDTYEVGGYFKGGDWTIGDAVQVSQGQGKARVFVKVTSDAGTYREDAESKTQAGNPENADLTFIASRSPGGWTMQTMELQAA